ncbi:MAG: hypothetical protein JXR37_08125 [Kiritimatiellae bacterium]|nr:hypothetical protein [Kiritimatiellia bacterium]
MTALQVGGLERGVTYAATLNGEPWGKLEANADGILAIELDLSRRPCLDLSL